MNEVASRPRAVNVNARLCSSSTCLFFVVAFFFAVNSRFFATPDAHNMWRSSEYCTTPSSGRGL